MKLEKYYLFGSQEDCTQLCSSTLESSDIHYLILDIMQWLLISYMLECCKLTILRSNDVTNMKL
jgi:hypothetical protein